jgi:glutamate synthase (NADPH/NADH) small chain
MADTKMLSFPHVVQGYPDKRVPKVRVRDFDEIYQSYAANKAAEQASRCSQCGVPFCQVHCPLHNNIPDWLKLTAEGRLEEAYALSAATNMMPEVCGRICPQDRLCEGNCVIEKDFQSVTIGAIERYLTDTAWEAGWVAPVKPLVDRRMQSVGIIGAGPAGLAAAEALRIRGYEVHIYDRYDRAGGLLIYGIPSFKLEKDIVARRVARLQQGGIHFHLNCAIGSTLSFLELRARHDALLVATGVYKARPLKAPGVGLPGIVEALDYLTAANRVGLGDSVADFASGALNAAGRTVVVVGGGDTAMDCVRTAVRQGAAHVTCLYRRDRANMPGSMREVGHAEEEGVRFLWLCAPEAFHGDDRVSAVHVQRMRLGLPDASGRQHPERDTGNHFQLPADMVIKALGFEAEELPTLFGCPELPVTRWGTLRVDAKSGMTNLEGVFGAGDIVRGASLVVWAIKDGRDVANSIHHYLQQRVHQKTQPLAVAG